MKRTHPLQNPFKPTAGKTPPELIGRDQILDEFFDGLLNGPGAPERLARISGARGTGKTVLMGEFRSMVQNLDEDWITLSETASPGFTSRIVEVLAKPSLFTNVRIKPTAFGVSLGSAEVGSSALNLRRAMEAATEKGRGLLVTIDEVQDAAIEEMRDLATAVQHLITEDRNIAFVFAGLPSAIDDVINAESLTFLYRANPIFLESIPIESVAVSFADTMRRLGSMDIDDELVGQMAEASFGYSFMIQLIGYYTWQTAYRRHNRTGGTVSAEDVQRGISEAKERFRTTVIIPALHRIPTSAKAYLKALAEEGGTARTSAVAAKLQANLSSTSSTRDRLLREGLIEAPARGVVRFAIPRMGDYLLDADDLLG